MTEKVEVDALVAGENTHPVGTETESVKTGEHSDDKGSTPKVEIRDGKTFVDGVRVYTRDDTNKIAANASKEVESRLLSDLQVDSIDQIKTVIKQLQEGNQDGGLNVDSLRDAVKKKEQTVEELRKELSDLKTQTVLTKHIASLQSEMPSQWTGDQKSAVLDLMKSRDMLHIDGDSFAIKVGDSFLTDESGEAPDYAGAIQLMGKTLGLPMAKKGVDTFDSDRGPSDTGRRVGVDENKMKADPAYRAAYVQVRERNKNLARADITDAMVKQTMGGSRGSSSERMLTGASRKPN